MARTRKRTINYRRCASDAPADGKGATPISLQEEVEAAASIVGKPWIRKISADGSQKQFLAYLVKKHGCICGTLIKLEDGRLVPLVDSDPDGKTWEGLVQPKDDKGNVRKFVEQVLYFAIRENHLAVIQTRELTIDDLLDFVVWFVQSKAELAEGYLITFQNLPSRSASEKLKDHKINSLLKNGRSQTLAE